MSLVGTVADRLRQSTQAAVTAERDLLTRQQLEYRTQREHSEAGIEELQLSQTELTAQLRQQQQIELNL